MRGRAEIALGLMFFQHLLGDIGSDADPERYGKIIVAQGWDVAAQELAQKRQGKAK
jgi:hypothetical protein